MKLITNAKDDKIGTKERSSPRVDRNSAASLKQFIIL